MTERMSRVALLAGALAVSTFAVGDRHQALNIVYPPEAFHHNGGRIIDVTRPPFGARGDGVTDDTRALIAAYDTVANGLRAYNWTDEENATRHMLYFPKGTYLVSSSIIYTGPKVTYAGFGWGGVTRMRIVGESRDSTIIRLKDNCTGFEAGKRTPLLAFQKEGDPDGNNIPGSNQLRNITIHTGRGNPGAVGVVFLGANKCDMNGVSILSGDGGGHTGLDLSFFAVLGHMVDVTIDGFDCGIMVDKYAETHPVFEHLTLRNQGAVAVQVVEANPVFRSFASDNQVPVVKISAKAGSVVLVDARLSGGASTQAAMEVVDAAAQLYARDVAVEGYGVSVRRGGADVVTGSIEEYVSGGVYSLFAGTGTGSIRLPVEDAPPVYWEQDLSQWANVDSFAGADDAERIQNAMNSGKSTVFFPRAHYAIARAVTIPASVRHIDMMFAACNASATFRTAEPSPHALWFENKDGRGCIEELVPRTLVVRNASLRYRCRHDQPTTTFLESVTNVGGDNDFCPSNARIWARAVNDETKTTANFKVYGGSMWVLGFKTEGPQPSFEVTNGGFCEVLGGYRNETMTDSGYPMVMNNESNVSFVGYTSMARVYEESVWETRGGETRKLPRASLPYRRNSNDYFVPLYVGYDPVAVEVPQRQRWFAAPAGRTPAHPLRRTEWFDLRGRKVGPSTRSRGSLLAGWSASAGLALQWIPSGSSVTRPLDQAR